MVRFYRKTAECRPGAAHREVHGRFDSSTCSATAKKRAKEAAETLAGALAGGGA